MQAMPRQFCSRYSWYLLLMLLFGTALACNLSPAPDRVLPSPPTPGGTIATPTEPGASGSDAPTATSTSILAATATPRIGTPAPTATLRGTPTVASGGLLTFDYAIDWRVDPNNEAVAIARVTITASGGNGEYIYFHDDLPVDGPQFEYRWAACRDNPGSLRVNSADGQTVRTNYFETPPCPDP